MKTKTETKTLLRNKESREGSKVVFVELFFDLVFAFTVTQLSHSLLHNLSIKGLLETIFLVISMWWIWIHTTWVTNWLDPQKTPVRLMLFVQMLAGIILSISIPDAFRDNALLFAASYSFMQFSRGVFMCVAMKDGNKSNFKNFVRVTTWLSFASLFWMLGCFVSYEARCVLWGAGLLIETLGPAFGFWTPKLGRSTTSDWNISGGHMAERCSSFVIIALGESLLVTGATFSELNWSDETNLIAFVTVFVNTVTIWWIYFNIGADLAAKRIEHSKSPGHMAISAYTYLHVVIISGIILVAVSNELVLKHPMNQTHHMVSMVLFGGQLIFLFGNFCFKKTIFGRYSLAHAVGMMMMLLMYFISDKFLILQSSIISTIILIVVAVWEGIRLKGIITREDQEA